MAGTIRGSDAGSVSGVRSIAEPARQAECREFKTTLTINAQAAIEDPNFSEPTPSGTRESKRAGSRPSLKTGTKWFEIKRRNNRQIDREPSG